MLKCQKLLINVKMPTLVPLPSHFTLTLVGILTFMSSKDSILCLPEPEKLLYFLISLYLWAFKISCSAELGMNKVLLPWAQVYQ